MLGDERDECLEHLDLRRTPAAAHRGSARGGSARAQADAWHRVRRRRARLEARQRAARTAGAARARSCSRARRARPRARAASSSSRRVLPSPASPSIWTSAASPSKRATDGVREHVELRRAAEETKGAAAGLGERPPDRSRQQRVDVFLPDDGRFECARLRGRLEPELFVEPQAEAAVAAEGLVLPAERVQSEHLQAVRSLAEAVERRSRLRVGERRREVELGERSVGCVEVGAEDPALVAAAQVDRPGRCTARPRGPLRARARVPARARRGRGESARARSVRGARRSGRGRA